MKIIVCPSCGEDVEIRDLYEGVEIQCDFCGAVLIYEDGRFILLDTNEEFDPEDLEKDFSEEREDDFEDDLDYDEFDDYYEE
ncbi:hypothetical protein GAH_01453 [Geoglobus ahangari]|uniref:Lysine biosynthesis protein LysW n=1 Tax=Geoglobus ahangari TaxID=113653 RepID=A0A0F7IFJ5_9EURY|nr:hypothetical protein [Geoglobus ahangari]AKG91255.1 hypothetical protein GAH_01453 [Geoglobus ahangari]